MLPDISIYQLKNQDNNQWFTCADINNEEEIICGTDHGIIYQTQSSNENNLTSYKQFIGLLNKKKATYD